LYPVTCIAGSTDCEVVSGFPYCSSSGSEVIVVETKKLTTGTPVEAKHNIDFT